MSGAPTEAAQDVTLRALLALVDKHGNDLHSLALDCEVARDTEFADMLDAFRGMIPWRFHIAKQGDAAREVGRAIRRVLDAPGPR